MNRRTTLLLLALAVAAPLAACGGSESSEQSSTSAGAASTEDFCAFAQQVVTAQTEIDTQLDGQGTPEALKAAFASYLNLLDGMRAAAPANLQADVATARVGFESFDTAMKDIDYDVARLAADPSLGEVFAEQLEVMRSVEVTTAMSNVDAYTVASCGISLDSTN